MNHGSHSHEPVQKVKFLGTSWATRGPIYWCRRAAISTLMVIACITTFVMTGGLFSSTFGAHGIWRYVVQILMSVSIAGGLWYGWLAFRASSAKKRPTRRAMDDKWANQFEAMKNWLNGDKTGIVDRLLTSPVVVLVPGIFLGVFFAVAIGSFGRYLSPGEFDAVQRRVRTLNP
jgi:hypothetical protein